MKHLKYNRLSNNHVRYLRKKTNCVMYCLYATRSELIIMTHSIPHDSNLFKSMFSPQTPVFLAIQCCFPGGWRITRVMSEYDLTLWRISLYRSIISDYTRRRRPMTLRIGPRLSLPNKSTSAPTTTTDGEWRALR